MRRHVYAWLVATIAAVFPTVVMAGEQEDQRIADHINQRLIEEKDRGALSDFSLDLYVEDGQVWIKGHVASSEQEQLVFRAAQSARELGVVKIFDMIEVQASGQPTPAAAQVLPVPSGVRQTSNVEEGPSLSSRRAEDPQVTPVAAQAPVLARPAAPQPVAMPATRVAAAPRTAPRGMPLAAAPADGGMPAAYMPMSHPTAVGAMHDQPSMPPYAWPSYAAHPNYGALSYPQQYSPSVWPYIGPFYPYPQVPLGWRKVTLEWDDGWWMIDFNDR